MNKETYLRMLRACLAGRLPQSEVEEILRYYTEYFEEAGPGRERAVMAELGSPERLAGQILGERGQGDLVPTAAGARPGGAASPAVPPRTDGGGLPQWAFVVLLVLAAIFVGPVVLGLVLGLGLGGVICVAVGLGVTVGGLGRLSLPGLLFQAGGGLMAAAVGVLMVLGAVLLVRLTAWLIRWFRDTFVERREGYEAGY